MVDTLVLALDDATQECDWQDKVQILRVGGGRSLRASKKRQERPVCCENEKSLTCYSQQIYLELPIFVPFFFHLCVDVSTAKKQLLLFFDS